MEDRIVLLIFVGIILVFVVVVLIGCVVEYLPKRLHMELHSRGYEVLDNVSTTNMLGEPIYFTVVRYKDGCIENIRIPAKEYFEKIGTVRSDDL